MKEGRMLWQKLIRWSWLMEAQAMQQNAVYVIQKVAHWFFKKKKRMRQMVKWVKKLNIMLRLFKKKRATLLFNKMHTCIFRAPMSLFDSTPRGRILNWASNDQSEVDTSIPYQLASFDVATIPLWATSAVQSDFRMGSMAMVDGLRALGWHAGIVTMHIGTEPPTFCGLLVEALQVLDELRQCIRFALADAQGGEGVIVQMQLEHQRLAELESIMYDNCSPYMDCICVRREIFGLPSWGIFELQGISEQPYMNSACDSDASAE